MQIPKFLVTITAGIPQTLSSSPRYYHGFYPHSHRNTAIIVPITTVITTVTSVLPTSPSPCHSLVSTLLPDTRRKIKIGVSVKQLLCQFLFHKINTTRCQEPLVNNRHLTLAWHARWQYEYWTLD